jgi:Rieske 2Fe-2S family protein
MATLQAALPRQHYVDEAQYEREREIVLARSWTCAGRLTDVGLVDGARTLLPNRLSVLALLGESVLVTTDADSRLHAHYNVCRHRGTQLVPHDPTTDEAPDPCGSRVLRCPYHSWTYAADGSLLRAPYTDDIDDFDHSEFALQRIGVDTWGGFLWLNLDPAGAGSLAGELGPIPERLRRYPLDRLVVGRRIVYDVKANWKVLAENYNECYHCGPVHPELCRLVPAFRSGGAGLDWDAGIPHRAGAWTFTTSGSTHRAPFPGLDADEQVRHKGELIYPNLFLSLAADHVASFVLHPAGAARTRVVFDVLVASEEADGDCSDAADFWDLVNRQDWSICESVQRGMSSRAYRQGWFAPMEDASLDIRRWLLPRLEAIGDE